MPRILATLSGVALLSGAALLLALQPWKAEAADKVCSADAKAANLDLKFKGVNGKPVALSDYKGKVVLIDFWATWCPPCRKEIPGFIDLYDRYQPRGLVIVGVSMDDSVSDTKEFAKRLKMNYPIVIGYGRNDLEPTFGDLPLPTAFLIGRDGKICVKHNGQTPKEQFEREIAALL